MRPATGVGRHRPVVRHGRAPHLPPWSRREPRDADGSFSSASVAFAGTHLRMVTGSGLRHAARPFGVRGRTVLARRVAYPRAVLTLRPPRLHGARSVFERPRVRRLPDRVTGVVLIGFGARVAAEAG